RGHPVAARGPPARRRNTYVRGRPRVPPASTRAAPAVAHALRRVRTRHPTTGDGTVEDTILVTGGAGFIGSAAVRPLIRDGAARVVNVDALTYAGDLATVAEAAGSPHYAFEHVDIRDAREVRRLFRMHRPRAVLHLAAESHVDRSIDGPAHFIETNVLGTLNLLEAAREHERALAPADRDRFRFLHASTDEVYGRSEEHTSE